MCAGSLQTSIQSVTDAVHSFPDHAMMISKFCESRVPACSLNFVFCSCRIAAALQMYVWLLSHVAGFLEQYQTVGDWCFEPRSA